MGDGGGSDVEELRHLLLGKPRVVFDYLEAHLCLSVVGVVDDYFVWKGHIGGPF